MTTEAPPINGAVNQGMRRYAEALGSRRAVQRVLGADTDPDFCLTDFLFCLATKQYERLHRVYEAERTKSPLGQTSGPSGGYLVPTLLQHELMADVAEEAIMRPRATVVSMSSSALRLPLPDATTVQSAGIPPFFGGIQLSWTQENATRTETEPTWRMVTLRAWDLSGYALQSNPLYQDGGSGLENYLRRLFARSVAWYEDYAYLQGNGVGKPMGIVNAPATLSRARGTSSHFSYADAKAMIAMLLPASWSRAIWLMHPTAIADLTDLSSTTTTAWQNNQPRQDQSGPVGALHTIPVYTSEKCSTLGTAGDVLLFDPQLYVIGDRGAVEIAFSDNEPTAFLKNQCVWRIVYRGDGQPWFSRSITLQDATTAVSPYVVLT